MSPSASPDTEGIAVVAGATGALGGAIVRDLRAAGLTVIAIARTEAALKEAAAADAGIVPCPADIGSDDSIERLRAAVDGPVRMIVQAAGLPVAGPLDTMALSALPQAVDLKVGGLLRMVRALEDRLGPGSRVVALGGHYGFEPAPHAPLAGMVNAALANLVRQLTGTLGARGATVHLVSPGPVDTERMRRMAADAATLRGVEAETVLDEYRAASPLGRLTTVGEVAWAVSCLLDPRADALTGSTLSLDAGRRKSVG